MIKQATKLEMGLLVSKSLSVTSVFLIETEQIVHKRLPTASG